MDAQLFITLLNMHAHGVNADLKQVGDFIVKKAFGQQGKNFMLPFGQRFSFGAGRGDWPKSD